MIPACYARSLAVFTCAAFTPACFTQDRSGLTEILNFEAQQSGSQPTDWGANLPGSVYLDSKIVHSGHWAVRIERQADTPQPFSGITNTLPVSFAGNIIELRGFVRIQLLVDGKPVSEAPRAEPAKTVLGNDRLFDAGSKIAIGVLTPVQIENLAMLGRDWGFFKYHHPRVTSAHAIGITTCSASCPPCSPRQTARRPATNWRSGSSPCVTSQNAGIARAWARRNLFSGHRLVGVPSVSPLSSRFLCDILQAGL